VHRQGDGETSTIGGYLNNMVSASQRFCRNSPFCRNVLRYRRSADACAHCQLLGPYARI